MAPFHGGDHDLSSSQSSAQDANSSHQQIPSLEKPIEPRKRNPVNASSQTSKPRESVTTLKASRPPPPRPAGRRRQPATQSGGDTQNRANRGRSKESVHLSLGLQLEPPQQSSSPHQYRYSEVDELSEMVSRMRTLSQGGVSITF